MIGLHAPRRLIALRSPTGGLPALRRRYEGRTAAELPLLLPLPRPRSPTVRRRASKPVPPARLYARTPPHGRTTNSATGADVRRASASPAARGKSPCPTTRTLPAETAARFRFAARRESDHARGRAARDARRIVRVARRRDDGLPTTRRPCPIRARCAFNALSAHARHGGRGAHIAAAKIAMTCASVALRGLVSMHASFCALPAITSWSSAFTPSAAKPDGMPIDAESARIAAMAARAASGVLMPAVLTPSSGAMAAKRSGAAIRLNSHTCGSRIALQTPCGRL